MAHKYEMQQQQTDCLPVNRTHMTTYSQKQAVSEMASYFMYVLQLFIATCFKYL